MVRGLGSTRNLGHPSRDVEIHQESRTIEPKRREGFATSGVAGWIDVDKSGGLKGSMQHWLAVYPPEFQIPMFFVAVD